MAQGLIFPKQQLEIAQVLEPKGYGTAGKELLPVMAKNLSLQEGDPQVGRPLKYTVFNQALQDHIKPLAVGARFLADIEERDRPDSQYGPDRNINQIYVDGNPISQKQGGGGGGNWRRSLEDDLALEAVKRRSIEGQSAMAQVGNALTCQVPIEGEALGIDEEVWTRILGKYWQAVERSLDNFLAESPKAANPTTPAARKALQPPPGEQPGGEGFEGAESHTDHVKNPGDLLTKALKKGLTPARVGEILGTKEIQRIGDLNQAWAKIEKYLAEVGQGKIE